MIRFLIDYYKMNNDDKWYDNHPTIAARFEEIEEWLEELEEMHHSLEARVVELELIAHPKCGIEGFDGYKPLVDRIDKLEVVVGVLAKND